MKLSVDREALLEGVTLASSVTPTHGPQPILQALLLRASGDTLEVAGTDLEVAVRCRISGIEVKQEGEIAPPATRLVHVLREFEEDRLRLSTSRGKLRIEGGEAEVEIAGHEESSKFPDLPRFTEEKAVSLRAGTWVRAVRRTAFAVAREAGRFAVNGTLVRVHDGKFLLVATDGRRLAWTGSSLEDEGSSHEARAVVPVKGLLTLGRAPSGSEDRIPMTVGGGQVAFRVGSAEIFAREIEGEFPNYDQILSREYPSQISIPVAPLERALRRAAQVTSEESHAVRFRFEEGRLIVGADTSAGKARSPVGVEGEVPDQALDIAFNPDFVLDFLKESGRDSVTFSFQDGSSAARFSAGDEYLYVVMPVTLG